MPESEQNLGSKPEAPTSSFEATRMSESNARALEPREEFLEAIAPVPAASSGAVLPSHLSGSGSSPRSADPIIELVPGLQLESFVIHHAIGAGGMGAVYLATDTRLERLVALKILPPEQARDAETVQRFYQEGRAAARLDHENIARVYTLGHDQGHHYIAFEYIEGITLRQQVAERGRLPASETIEVALQIASALVHASDRGVVHRDIKPSNIIVTPHGTAKLVDMGLARRFERTPHDDGLTQSGMTLGTFDYISPEQARDPRHVDVRSDLYSLGCTMFQMLTGRPPFPEGTVLQKLLQHQEEPAPDVRTFNPGVPAELSSIVRKLMEKDRERRYQTPQSLRDDLTALAHAIQPPSAPAGAAVSQSSLPAVMPWLRHVVWGVPSLALAVVVAALILSGRPVEPRTREFGTPGQSSEPAAPAVAPRGTLTAQGTQSAPQAPTVHHDVSDTLVPEPLRREIPVASDQDLSAILARASSGSTFVLVDNGPYTLHAIESPTAPKSSMQRGRDLTIKADVAIRPVLRRERARGVAGRSVSLLEFQGGRIHLEGLEFRLETTESDGPVAAVLAQDCDLTVTRCLFRRSGPESSHVRASAIDLRGPADQGRSPSAVPPLRVVASSFDSRLVGIRAQGPADIHVRDCSFGPEQPAIWFDNSASTSTVQVDVNVRNASVLVGSAPVLRFANTAARVVVEHSAFAPAAALPGTLVATDRPGRLDWRGRENLYGRIGTFLQPTSEAADAAIVRTFEAWTDPADTIRELRSKYSPAHIWAQDDPLVALAAPDPSLAFQLAPGFNTASAGVREGPRGPVPRRLALFPDLLAIDPMEFARSLPRSSSQTVPTASPAPDSSDQGASLRDAPMPSFDPLSAPMPLNSQGSLAAGEAGPPAEAVRPSAVPDSRAPMDQMPPTDAESVFTTSPHGGATSAIPPLATGRSTTSPSPADAATSGLGAGKPSVISFAEDLRRALGSSSVRLEPVLLESDARMELEPISIGAESRRVLEAQTGTTRPILVFKPPAGEPPNADGEPHVLFRLGAASTLELRGIDLVVHAPPSSPRGPTGLFLLGPGSELVLTRCTVTYVASSVDPDRIPGAVVHVGGSTSQGAGVEAGTATLRIEDCVIRSDGGVIDVASGRRVDVSATNALLAAAGTVLRAGGSMRGRSADPLRLALRQTTARVGRGLVRLVSSLDASELPVCDIVARDSILATNTRGEALFRIEGQDDLDELRNRIAWEGHGVAYHLIDTYRLDNSAQAGISPIGFKRLTWEVAVGPREHDSFHGDVRFTSSWLPERPPSTATLADAQLASDTPVPSAGARVERLPAPPALPD
jgi:serine/threonine-protein kinase